MSQNSLWQTNQQNNDFAEICNALYERELRVLANIESATIKSVQGRLKSLSYYINRTANLMTQVNTQGTSPLTLDVQNASWSAKQASKIPMSGQAVQEICAWYLELITKNNKQLLGLVVPILCGELIVLDCIDRIDSENKRLRTNASGWFAFGDSAKSLDNSASKPKLLRPNKKVMLAACAGHCWKNSNKVSPVIPSLRELLLSCAVNWRDFHKVMN